MFSDNLKEKLLKAGHRDDSNHPAMDGSSSLSGNSRKGNIKKRLYSEAEIISRMKKKPPTRISPGLRRRFLIRLAIALHSYGSSASRTEYLIDKAADKLNVKANISVFPSLILLSFPGVDLHDPNQKEIYMIQVDPDLDVDKLGRADELANGVGQESAPLLLAYWRLKAIASAPPEFGKWWKLFGFSLSGSMSSLLFFNGSLWDALFSLLLGFIVGILDILASRSNLYGSVFEFTAALVVSFLARTFQVYFKSYELCFFAMALSALVQLLPGLSLTLGVSEMVAKSHVTGTSRVMNALFSALQLGFGLAMGENLVVWAPKPVTAECVSPTLPLWLKFVWFCAYTLSSNILLNARLDQWPGMTLASFVGYVVSEVTGLKLSSSASSVISAFAVGITGTTYSRFTGDLPLVMVLSGILLLVPGGIGVQGVTRMLGDDVLSGLGFVFDMVMVGLSITLGLLIAKIALPSAIFGSTVRVNTHSKSTLPRALEHDRPEDALDSSNSNSDSDSEEDMAI
ncbi:uncharacterized protein C7D4.12c [Physcomitrium patens]|uniref:Threonine/serine exporter-like N-terminal domain-containing protein n=1 Tax=Physcomitrium patens TaxID=3218 RepID=A9RRL3_PHYPA|nr:pheromone-regulated membrane protein 10-like [Physcomitrium patens]XP_024384417.1 pheromone-regulated membrane protein 10-like [Physcomitrium patens]PNR48024.1 hypothetical protein PHYPA_012497 [Physcomitrium patens]|eukprot:XP_024384416.1 pheromone-regulated membrane protein 10-like [Physcomitrella patens]